MNLRKMILPVFAAVFISYFGSAEYVHAEEANSASRKTIVLDAGHGGSDPGAVSNGYREKDLNMAIVGKVADRLKALGYNVVLTRTPSNDTFISLEDRAKLANDIDADLFISIHHDSSATSSANGTSIHYSSYKPGIDNEGIYVVYNGTRYKYLREGDGGYYIDYNGTEKFISIYDCTAYDATPSQEAVLSSVLASRLEEAMWGLGIADRGVRDHNLYVTRKTNMVSVLVEVGFISNPSEVQKLADEGFQNTAADRIAQSVNEFAIDNIKPKGKSLNELYKEAYDATIKAQETKNQQDLTEARVLVDELLKTLPLDLKNLGRTFSTMLDKVQQPLLIKTIAAIETAKNTGSQADINTAREFIIYMPTVWKRSYSAAIDKIQQDLINRTIVAVNTAKESGDIADAEAASNLYNELLTVTYNDGVKLWVQAVLKSDVDNLQTIRES